MNCQGGNISEIASNPKHIRNRYRYVINELKDKKGTVLVIGSGEGAFERILKEANPLLHVTSSELDPAFKDKLEDVSDSLYIGDFLDLKTEKKFDYIVSIDMIEHIIDTDSFFIKAGELLAKNGIFYLQTPNLASWHGRLSLLFGFTPEALEVSTRKGFFGKPWIFRHDIVINHVRVFTYRALREMSGYYGFRIESAVGIDHRLPGLFSHLPSIAGSVCLKLKLK